MNSTPTQAPTTALEVARYFLALQDEEAGLDISNLKLQKLLYYAQGIYLAMHGKPLFPERIEAWTYGPVICDIYHTFKQYGGETIPIELAVTETPIQDKEIRDFLDVIYEVFGQFSPWMLRDMTHEEGPYKETRVGGEISPDSMKRYCKRYVEDNG